MKGYTDNKSTHINMEELKNNADNQDQLHQWRSQVTHTINQSIRSEKLTYQDERQKNYEHLDGLKGSVGSMGIVVASEGLVVQMLSSGFRWSDQTGWFRWVSQVRWFRCCYQTSDGQIR